MQKNLKKDPLKCPICNNKFIPEAFHLEKVIMDTMDTSRGVNIISEREAIRELEIKPHNLLRKAWITNCPQCNFILRFTAELVKKELNELEGRKISNFNEMGINYFYNLYNYAKPCMDYADYYKEALLDIKSKIQNVLEKINIEELGKLCRDFMTDKKVDAFKFLIRFYGILEKYCNSLVSDDNEKNMYQKIKESSFPQQLENSLDEIRDLRNKIVHEGYDLTQDDEEKIKNAVRIKKKISEPFLIKVEGEEEKLWRACGKIVYEFLFLTHRDIRLSNAIFREFVLGKIDQEN
ncbi:hypothetical protein LCGC14_3055680, partial [marine sediment metagenome]